MSPFLYLIRGIMITTTIDWVSVTMPETIKSTDIMTLGIGEQVPNAKSPLQKGYNRGWLFTTGVFLNWNDKRPDMGYHIVASGSALREVWALGTRPDELLSRLVALKGRVSRVDYAIDIDPSELTLADLGKHKRLPYKGKGRVPDVLPVGTEEDGWTVYVGARTSDKMLRIYQKSKEQGDMDGKHVRIELEVKGDVAHWLGHELGTLPREEGYKLASAIIRGVADYPHKDYQSALSQDAVGYSIPKRTGKDTIGWLKGDVASAIARLMIEKPHIDVWGEFCEAVRGKMAERGIEAQ